MKLPLLLTCALSLFFLHIQAQWTTDSTMNTTVRDSAGAMAPLMASLPNGNTYVVWYENSATNLDLRMQLLDANGYKLWAPGGIVVSNYPQTTATYRYDMKTDHDGNAIVAFQDIRTNGNLNVVVYKIDALGNSVWGPAGVSLIDSGSTEGLAPVIGITAQNEVVVAWNADSSSKKWIACERLSASGTPVWNNFFTVRDSNNVLNYSRPKLIPSGNDEMLMMYVEEAGSFPGVTSTLYAQKINSGGAGVWSSPVMISTNTIPFFEFPQPVADKSGGFFVAFNSSNPVNSSLNDVFVQHIDNNGNLWNASGNEAANSTVNNKTTPASCYIPSSGDFWVLLQYEDGGQGMSGVSVQRFDSSGNIYLGHDGLVVIPMDPIFYIPTTINDISNGIILTFYFGPFGNQHLIAVRLDYSGVPVWMNTTNSLSAANSNKDKVQSGDFIDNNLVIVWQDDRNGSGIFAQNIDSTGSLGILTGISNLQSLNDVRFFPNPSKTPQIFFASQTKSDKIVKITDVEGRELMIFNIPSSQNSFILSDMDNLKQGIYFVSVNSADDRKIFKWIKN